MKPKEALLYAAIHDAGHVAACIRLGIEFGEIAIIPRKGYVPIVTGAVLGLPEQRYGNDFTAEQERHFAHVIIMAFAGPAAESIHSGRRSFFVSDYPDLNEVLDVIEHQFRNLRVRRAFTKYCVAKSFALFDDDKRLWKFVLELATELLKRKKLTVEQCLAVYEKVYATD